MSITRLYSCGSSKKVKKCFARVDATSFKATLFMCDENVEAVAYIRKAETCLPPWCASASGKREVRTYALPDVKETSRTTVETKVDHDMLVTLAISDAGQVFASIRGELHLVDPRTKRVKTHWRKDAYCYDAVWVDEQTVVGLCDDLTRFDTTQLH